MSVISAWAARRYGGAALFYEKFTAPLERAGLAQIRSRLAGDLRGRILEIGCGTGRNFAHYPSAAEVIAIEPLDDYRVFAAERAKSVPARVTVQAGDAEALPFPDASFDAALETLVFCSVPDPLKGLGELRRVLRRNGPVRFFEHVRSTHRLRATLQDIINPVWRWATDGCNLNRDTVAIIAAAGFRIEEVREHDLRPPRAPHFPMREIRARA